MTIEAAAAGQGTCSTSGQNVTCVITGLAPGQSAPVNVVVTPTAAGTYATSMAVAVTSPLSDPNAANDTASATLTAHALAPAPVAPPTVAPPPTVTAQHAHAAGTAVTVRVTCHGSTGTRCHVVLKLTIVEVLRGKSVVGVAASGQDKTTKRTVTVGARSIVLTAGRSTIATVALNAPGRRLLRQRRRLQVRLTIKTKSGHATTTASTQLVTLTPANGARSDH